MGLDTRGGGEDGGTRGRSFRGPLAEATAEVLQHETFSGSKETNKMKKILAGIAVLAFVSAAQAELLATWSTGGSGTANKEHITVGNLTAATGEGFTAKTTSGGIFGLNTFGSEAEGGGGFQFTFGVDDTYIVKDATMIGIFSGSTAGPAKMDWYVDGAAVSGATMSRSSNKSTSFSNLLGDLSGNKTISLLADMSAGNASGAALSGNSGTFNLRGSLTMDGTLTESGSSAVPEPATMSLLGLGALAMVIRRKLRK